MSSVNTTTLELMYYCNMFRLRGVIVRRIDIKEEHTPTPPPAEKYGLDEQQQL